MKLKDTTASTSPGGTDPHKRGILPAVRSIVPPLVPPVPIIPKQDSQAAFDFPMTEGHTCSCRLWKPTAPFAKFTTKAAAGSPVTRDTLDGPRVSQWREGTRRWGGGLVFLPKVSHHHPLWVVFFSCRHCLTRISTSLVLPFSP